MSRKLYHRVFLCGGDYRPGPRDECPAALHDWPLPAGYVDAAEVAARRLRSGWSNRRCPRCKLCGWEPGKIGEGDTRVEPAPSTPGGSDPNAAPGGSPRAR